MNNNNIAKYRLNNYDWQTFGKDVIVDIHGDMYYYRNLYEGNHHEIFPRAINLINRGEIVDVYADDKINSPKNVRTPYIMLNVSKIIVDVPSMFVSRSIGQVKTNHTVNSIGQEEMKGKENNTDNAQANENNFETNNTDDETNVENSTQKNGESDLFETTDTNDFNSVAQDPQQATIDQIIQNSKLNHYMNITQLQVDGGIVAVPSMRNDQISIDIKERNVYYPHDDDMGVDLVYELPQTVEEEINKISYVHVYTERQNGQSVTTYHRLYSRNKNNEMELVIEPAIIEDKLRLGERFNNGVLEKTFAGRQRLFVCYLPNNPTFMNELGNSTLKGLDGKQEEVNWTLTRTAQTFERNGKPRISIPKGTMNTLKQIAADTYGNENQINHELLEVTEIDEVTGKSMEIHQIDTTKIGDMTYVKEIVRAMLAETQTSENAVELVKRDTANSQSGTAKFYDLIVSIIKSERIRNEYVEFLKDIIESALWFANKKDSSVIIERPNIMLKDMLPQPKQELSTDNIAKYNAKVQSLEETVRANNPDKSEEWVQEEIQRIEDEKSSTDSLSLTNGAMNLQQFMNNRDENGDPIQEETDGEETDNEDINSDEE
ncbi:MULTISPECIES: hypothetical protein [unclassified Staphylococcus]|uniref:hypothetical protein n=1 Tax=unclassified Staphylococcus TaxID=91994 RepID=UPI00122DC75E|nr:MULTISPECIES: hypothetical protein [unclassified Staphylococcus]KAA2278095.1 hypothetical protein F1592_00815 [Staphylococcus sp. GDX7P312P]KAA2281468.1 hypothetical protein F1591_03190 [Staphylococcus sp. GDX7P459A]